MRGVSPTRYPPARLGRLNVRSSRKVQFNLSGLTYSTAANLGTENTHYYRTRYGYADEGRRDRVQRPTGTIERTIYDGQDRVVSSWVGTNDTPSSGLWSPGNNGGSANMAGRTHVIPQVV